MQVKQLTGLKRKEFHDNVNSVTLGFWDTLQLWAKPVVSLTSKPHVQVARFLAVLWLRRERDSRPEPERGLQDGWCWRVLL